MVAADLPARVVVAALETLTVRCGAAGEDEARRLARAVLRLRSTWKPLDAEAGLVSALVGALLLERES